MLKVILTNGSISPAPFSGQRTLIIPSHLMLSHYFNVSDYAFFFLNCCNEIIASITNGRVQGG